MVRWEDIHPNEQASLKERLAGRYSALFRQTPWVEASSTIIFHAYLGPVTMLGVPWGKQTGIVWMLT